MTSDGMQRRAARGLRGLTGVVAAILAGAAAMSATAQAQGRLEAQYEASLAGLQIGKGTWTIDIGEDQYSAAASGGTTGLLNAFASGHGNSSSQGRVINGLLAPSSYLAAITSSSKKTETIRIQLAGGNVKDFSIEPEPEPASDRIPVTEAHRKGVVDPMTGSLIHVAGTADPVGPEACASSMAVFDGRLRYDLKLAYKRLEAVKVKGYQGQVVVCAMYFTPISGYTPDRPAIKYLAGQRNMEVWLAPIAGTRVLVPLKVLVPTPVGMAMLQATQFVSTGVVRTTAKTQ